MYAHFHVGKELNNWKNDITFVWKYNRQGLNLRERDRHNITTFDILCLEDMIFWAWKMIL